MASGLSRLGPLELPRSTSAPKAIGSSAPTIWTVAIAGVLVCLAAGLLLKEAFDAPPIALTPLFLAAVVAASWFGGAGPGLLAGALSLAALAIFLIDPSGKDMNGPDAVGLLIFAVAATALGRATLLFQKHMIGLTREAREMEDFFENSTVAMHMIDHKGTIAGANKTALALLGYERAGYAGHQLAEFIVDPTIAEDVLLRLQRGQELRDYAATIRGGDGRPHDVLISTDAFRREDGYVRCVVKDVTEVRRWESELQSKARELAVILSAVGDGVVAQSPDGRLVYANEVALRILGARNVQDVAGVRIADLLTGIAILDENNAEVSPEDLAGAAVLQSQARTERLLHYRPAEQADRWILVKSQAVMSEDARLEMIVSIMSDVSRVQREERDARFLADVSAQLASSMEYQATLSRVAEMLVPEMADWCLIEVLEDGMLKPVTVVHEDESRMNTVRELLDRRYSTPRTPEEIARITTMPARLIGDLRETIDNVQDPGRREIIESLGLTSGVVTPLVGNGRGFGLLVLINAQSNRRFSQDDLAFAEDIGRRAGMAIENARLYTESQQARAELQRSTAAKDEFLGILAHELRTPITTIYGGARFLNSRGANVPEETRRQLIDAMQEDAGKLNRLVENLLTLARTELGQPIPKEPVHVEKLIEGFLVDYRRRRPGRELVLHKTVSADGDSSIVDASPAYIEQILTNLIENSNKYSDAGLPIELELRSTPDEVQVLVRDRGPGIAPEEMNLIFDSFYRSEKTARKAPGKGLGLAVCKRLIEAHAGRIWAQPRPGGGLEVGFALPVVPSEVL